jgi:hypothetical protein
LFLHRNCHITTKRIHLPQKEPNSSSGTDTSRELHVRTISSLGLICYLFDLNDHKMVIYMSKRMEIVFDGVHIFRCKLLRPSQVQTVSHRYVRDRREVIKEELLLTLQDDSKETIVISAELLSAQEIIV